MTGIIKNRFCIGQTVFASNEHDFTQIFTGEITRIEICEGKLSYQVRDQYGYREYMEDQIFTDKMELRKDIITRLQNEVEEAYERLKRFRENMENE